MFVNEKRDQDKIVNSILTWINNPNIKNLAIKSSMGSGKTQLTKKIIQKINKKSILWITHRQTLTMDLYGNFEMETL